MILRHFLTRSLVSYPFSARPGCTFIGDFSPSCSISGCDSPVFAQLWNKICFKVQDGKSPTLGLCLDLILNFLLISGVVQKGGASMFWLLIIGVAVGLLVNCIIKATRGDGYLPDVVEDEGEI